MVLSHVFLIAALRPVRHRHLEIAGLYQRLHVMLHDVKHGIDAEVICDLRSRPRLLAKDQQFLIFLRFSGSLRVLLRRRLRIPSPIIQNHDEFVPLVDEYGLRKSRLGHLPPL